jgi:hypothetical protein
MTIHRSTALLRLVAASLAATALVAPLTATAKPRTPPPARAADDPATVEAKAHFDKAVRLFDDGDYNGALVEFTAAYDRRPSPGVLYNIGLTQKALFRVPEAIASLERYLAEAKNVPPARAKEVRQVITELRALLADVILDVTPPGAQLRVDGRTVGAAPAKLQLPTGGHTLEFSLDGYKPARKDVLITSGVPVSVKLALEAIPRTGFLVLDAEPAQATARVDERPLGKRPWSRLELIPGPHRVEVEADGFTPYRGEVALAPGQERTLAIRLERPAKKKRFYEKAAFWVPVSLAVVGVGVGVGLGVGLSQSEPVRGTLDPFAKPID